MIHHYTSIHNLALILKSKKVRFNRLDRMDDTTELNGMAQFFSTCIFGSSWTEDSEESIPLWKMYTPNMQGVRISLPVDMFQKKQVQAFTEENYGLTKDYIGPLSKEETFTDDYIVTNVFVTPNSFYNKIIYNNEYPELYKQQFEANNQEIIIKNIHKLGIYKHKRWTFQNESRFLLYTNPLLPLSHPLVNGSKFQQMQLASYPSRNNIPNRVSYIDLDEKELNKIIVTIGPLSTYADEIVIILNKGILK